MRIHCHNFINCLLYNYVLEKFNMFDVRFYGAVQDNQMLTGKQDVGFLDENVDRSVRCWAAMKLCTLQF